MDNIQYGKLDATEDDCKGAANEANINKFSINNEKKEEIEGEKKDEEVKISKIEKKRLDIARAFLKNPIILLLDEVTSSLNKNDELEIQKYLDKLRKNRTSITITKRLNAIEKFDKIFVLESGRLVEQGNHQELISLKNKYYNLYKYSVTI